MKRFAKMICLALAIVILTCSFILPAAAAEEEISPRYEAKSCLECSSTNTTFLGYTYLFTEYLETYKVIYYDANYRCNSCGASFSTLHTETAPIS